jgi:hypothetical protein
MFLLTLLRRVSLGLGGIGDFARRWRSTLQVITVASTLCLGLWGWTIATPPMGWGGWIDNLYKTLQLVTLTAPPVASPSWPLRIARLLVPIATVLVTIDVITNRFTRPIRAALFAFASGHVIVRGLESLSEDALNLLAPKRSIALVAPNVSESQRTAVERAGVTVIDADLVRESGWENVAPQNASAIVISGPNDGQNLEVAASALDRLRPRKSKRIISLLVVIRDDDLAADFAGPLDALARSQHVDFHRLAPERDAIDLRLGDLERPGLLERPMRILVVGLSGVWRSPLLRLVAAAQDHPSARPQFHFLLKKDEEEALGAWLQFHPELDVVTERSVETGENLLELEELAVKAAESGPYDLAIVFRPSAEASRTGLMLLKLRETLLPAKAPIFVRVEGEPKLLRGLQRFAPELEQLVPFGSGITAPTIERVLHGRGEDLARALHAAYRAAQGAGGSDAASADWEGLPDNLRRANRAAAAHIPVYEMLLARLSDQGSAVSPSPEVLEQLAPIEHRRWVAERIHEGWHHGPVRDNLRRRHPSLVPFDRLSAEERQKDRDAVLTGLDVSMGRSRGP